MMLVGNVKRCFWKNGLKNEENFRKFAEDHGKASQKRVESIEDIHWFNLFQNRLELSEMEKLKLAVELD
jgi:aminopeptidase N